MLPENKTIQINDHEGKELLEITIHPIQYDLKTYAKHIRQILKVVKKGLFDIACEKEMEKLDDGTTK